MKWFTVVGIDHDDDDTFMLHVKARNAREAESAAAHYMSEVEGVEEDITLTFVLEGKLANVGCHELLTRDECAAAYVNSPVVLVKTDHDDLAEHDSNGTA